MTTKFTPLVFSVTEPTVFHEISVANSEDQIDEAIHTLAIIYTGEDYKKVSEYLKSMLEQMMDENDEVIFDTIKDEFENKIRLTIVKFAG